MRFSTKTRYGIRAMLEIAKANPEEGILQKDISQNQEISNKYLDQIILALKVSGLICNVKGRKSGYILTRNSSEITMLDIHNSFEHGICVIDCIASTYKCPRHADCLVKSFWFDLNDKIVDHFKSTTLLDLINNKQIL
jgi:Rrf2 family protein